MKVALLESPFLLRRQIHPEQGAPPEGVKGANARTPLHIQRIPFTSYGPHLSAPQSYENTTKIEGTPGLDDQVLKSTPGDGDRDTYLHPMRPSPSKEPPRKHQQAATA